MTSQNYKTRHIKPVPQPSGHLQTGIVEDESKQEQAGGQYDHDMLNMFISAQGDICHLLTEVQIADSGMNAVNEWNDDKASIEIWRAQAQRGLKLASGETEDEAAKTIPWDGSANVHFPLIVTAAQQWGARAYPELIRGDAVVGIKSFATQSPEPTVQAQTAAIVQRLQSQAQATGQQPDPQLIQSIQKAIQQAVSADQQQRTEASLQTQADESRAKRVAEYLNWVIFYKMTDWEGDTDLLLNNLPITGCGFKRVFMTSKGLNSRFISPMNLTVHANTDLIEDCPRVTYEYTMPPYKITQEQRSGRFREVDLSIADESKQEPRELIEQLRYEDFDDDGLPEPYLVTVDVQSMRTLRIEPAYCLKDIVLNKVTGQIIRVERYNPYASFKFLLDPTGNFYSTGFAKLLDHISQTIDTLLNQIIDAGTASIAGGGFISSGARFQQDGGAQMSPGEYKYLDTRGQPIGEMIWEHTVPQVSDVSMKLLMMLVDQAKEIASIKDVMSGEGNQMAAVGTVYAMQDQALKVFSAIYKRVYRGFREEFSLMYDCLKRFKTDMEREEYKELTGGDMDADFSGDGTDIQPVADPQAVSRAMRLQRLQAVMSLAESPIGQAAGMAQAQVAQEIVKEMLADLDMDRPERFIATVQPNPLQAAEVQAKVQDLQSKAALNQANAQKANADVSLVHAKTTREVGLAALDNAETHKKADELANGSPDDALTTAQIHHTNADTTLTHAKTVREVGLAHMDMMPEPADSK